MDARKILLKAGADKAIKIQVATAATWPKIRAQLSRVAQAWAEAQWWSPAQDDNVAAILDLVKRRYNVDENRVVLSGVSDGGTAAFYVAMRDTTPYASFLPLNGFIMVLRNRDVGVVGALFPHNLTNKPFFVVNGGQDRLYPAARVDHDDNSGPGNDALIDDRSFPVQEEYLLAVSAADPLAGGTYEIGMWIQDFGADPLSDQPFSGEREPNDTAETASDASSGDAVLPAAQMMFVDRTRSPPITTPSANKRSNRRPNMMASAMSLTCTSSKQSRRASSAIWLATCAIN